MERIRKFESFKKYREPTKVSYDEWLKKIDIHQKEPFTEKETKFFKELIKENRIYIQSYTIGSKQISIMLIEDDDDMTEIEFTKLEDNWFTIYKCYNHDHEEYFVCDEWDEVLGYIIRNPLDFPISKII
jgi:hypothetical protein